MGNEDVGMQVDKLMMQVAKLEEQNDTQFKRLDEMKNEIKEVNKVALSVERLAFSVEQMAKSLEKLSLHQKEQDEKIDKMRFEPADAWKSFKWILVGILTTGLVGGTITALFALIK